MFSVILKHRGLIVGWGVVLAIIVGAVSWFLPFSYSAESQVLIITNDRGASDPYTEAKAAERIGESLAAVIPTDDFYEKVMGATSMPFDRERWAQYDARTRRKRWAKDVEASVTYGTSLLKLTVYSTSQADALNLSNAVTETLASRGGEYVGGNITIKTVNSPLLVPLQTRPNIIINAVVAFFAGIVLSAAWLVRYKKAYL